MGAAEDDAAEREAYLRGQLAGARWVCEKLGANYQRAFPLFWRKLLTKKALDEVSRQIDTGEWPAKGD